MNINSASDLKYIKGIGEKRAETYAKLDIHTPMDLINHLPRKYIDFTSPYTVENAPIGESVPIIATVSSKSGEQRIRKNFSVFKVTAVSVTQKLHITFFNTAYTVKNLKVGEDYIFYGKVEDSFLDKQMSSPEIFPIETEGGLYPIYPATNGLSSKIIGKNIASLISIIKADKRLTENLPQDIVDKYDLCDRIKAYELVHSPASQKDISVGRRRLVFEELLCFSMALNRMQSSKAKAKSLSMKKYPIDDFWNILPFAPTDDQKNAVYACIEDMCGESPMSRLIEGDVGSGKTIVAAATAYFVYLNGYESAIMAPTEILAEQHYKGLKPYFDRLGIKSALLTGSTTTKNKRLIKQELESGEIDICIGTHALLTDDVIFKRLGLVITDEQHRFGVSQRMGLSQKGDTVNMLVMSATPIPRTLGLVLYGDMQKSVIKQLPKGRQPIETYFVDGSKRLRAYNYIKKHLDRGLQGYIICPLVDETEEVGSGKQSAVSLYSELQEDVFKSYRLGLLHGKMKPKEKEEVMTAFAEHRLDLLIATTVIEVGIDVPNAAIILIENAECFGLSQLHQLRGRVGRGSEQSTCILISDSKNDETKKRLKALKNNRDGFAIAEFDLQQRGPGDFFGMRQHGIPQLKIADLTENADVFEQAKFEGDRLIKQKDFSTSYPELNRRIEEMMNVTSVL